MDKRDDTAFGEFLARKADEFMSPLAQASSSYAADVITRLTRALSTGNVANTLQGDLELRQAEFLDGCVQIWQNCEPPPDKPRRKSNAEG